MQSKQDSKRTSRNLDPFALRSLSQPIPPRRRPQLKRHPLKWLMTTAVFAVLLGSVGCSYYRYVNNWLKQNRSQTHFRTERLARMDHHAVSDDRKPHPVRPRHLTRVRRHAAPSSAQLNRLSIQNETRLGEILSQNHVNSSTAGWLLYDYERNDPRQQPKIYQQIVRVCRTDHNPTVQEIQLQKLSKKNW